MVRHSVHKLLRTWFGLLINVLKREESVCAAIFSEGGRFIWKKSSPLGPSDETVQAVIPLQLLLSLAGQAILPGWPTRVVVCRQGTCMCGSIPMRCAAAQAKTMLLSGREQQHSVATLRCVRQRASYRVDVQWSLRRRNTTRKQTLKIVFLGIKTVYLALYSSRGTMI